MRTSSKFRRTKTFSILSGEAVDIASIVNFYGRDKIISISRDPSEDYGVYVVRLCEAKALIDARVKVNYRYIADNVEELERVVIVSAPVEAGASGEFKRSIA